MATAYAPNRSVPLCVWTGTTTGASGLLMSTTVRLFPLPSSLLPLAQLGAGPGAHGPFWFLLVTNAWVPTMVTLTAPIICGMEAVDATSVGLAGLERSITFSWPDQ